MKVQMLKNAFLPNEYKRVRTILQRESLVEVSEEEGEILIDKGYAVAVEPKKAEKPVKSDTPDETWTVPELKAYAEEKGIDISTAKNKTETLALITPAA